MARIHRTAQKDLHDPDNHGGVITYLEPDILECKVKWALGSITTNKTNGDHGIPVELFQILKDDAVKVLHSICQQIWKTQQWPQDWKRSVFIPIPKESNAKEYSNYHTIALILHASKVMFKILQARLQQYMNCELQMFKLDLEKVEEPEIKWPKPLTVWITTNWKILKEMRIPGHFTCLLRNCMQIKKQQLKPNKEQ